MTQLGEGAADEQRNAMLRAIVVGDRFVEEKEVQEMIRRDPEFARQARELLALQQSLEGFGVLQSAPPAPALEDIAMRTVRERVAAARRLRLLRGWATAVAAAVVIGVVLWFWRPWRREVAPQMLGGNLKVEVVENGTALRFGFSLAPGGYFVVSTMDRGGRNVGTPIRLSSDRWQPDVELQVRWQSDWWIRVDAFDESGLVEAVAFEWQPGQAAIRVR